MARGAASQLSEQIVESRTPTWVQSAGLDTVHRRPGPLSVNILGRALEGGRSDLPLRVASVRTA